MLHVIALLPPRFVAYSPCLHALYCLAYNLTFRIPSDLMRAFMLDLLFCCFVLALPHILVKKKKSAALAFWLCSALLNIAAAEYEVRTQKGE
jgi:hypothetical protein